MYTDKNGKNWYKGNLHTHTTVSDGRYKPEETLALYRENGYDFIALTDHWKYGEGGLDEKTGILVIPGCEYNTGAVVPDGVYHIVCAFADREPVLDRTEGNPSGQVIVDAIKEAGGVAILAHPAWSLNDPAHVIAELKGLDAAEIYNTVSGKPWNLRPYSGLFVDRLFSEGVNIGCMAADDAHFYNGDACVSFIYVNAESCTREALREAILSGRYTASQGPMLRVWKDGDTVYAETDEPVTDITFFSDAVYARDRVHIDTDGITSASYKPMKHETFVRVEATDKDGRCAWSSAIRLK